MECIFMDIPECTLVERVKEPAFVCWGWCHREEREIVTMSALCLSLLLACQPVVFGRGYPQEEDHFWGQKSSHPNDVNFDVAVAHGDRSVAASWSHLLSDALGPPNWPIVEPACGGRFQSPINIVTEDTLVVKRKIPLEIVGLNNLPAKTTVENEGHSVKFTPQWSGRTRPMMRGGPLRTTYFFEQLHFHWGPNATEGSEHMINGRQFPLEVHLVFYNGLYGSFDAAKTEVDGLAVVGFLYEVVSNSASFTLNYWAHFLPQVRQPNAEVVLSFARSFTLQNVVGPMGWSFFSYEGSLTTPPCLETVTWIVSAKRLAVTEQELQLLRSLIGSNRNPMRLNYRPVQPLYSRRVFQY
ncbi:carbonic anhydrase 7-like [Anopheles nili]|uniref:carbonic anhydrase 7-like n=1 Tax=Anopheles nili TaxID=185578 RepID=UPI00237AB07D|nr:carbonic anhydrase 7-like [Anopheles nili]